MKSAVLICGFNRPDNLKRVLSKVLQADPSRIYLSIDGPRDHRDVEKVQATRAICTSIARQRNVHIRFNERNQGCGQAVAQAVAWFFGQEDRGIVLEDDTLPSERFFIWCEHFLKRFEADYTIQGICGTHPGSHHSGSVFEDPFDLSRYFFCWGWASWQNRLANFSVSEQRWDEQKAHSCRQMQLMGDFEREFWTVRFRKSYAGDFGTWDYQMMHQSWIADRLWVVPRKNLVTNIGFGPDATHTVGEAKHEEEASKADLEQQLAEAPSHQAKQDLTREAVRFLNVFNRDWAGVGNVLAESELHNRVIQLKKRVFHLESLMKSPLRLAKHIFNTGAFRQWRP